MNARYIGRIMPTLSCVCVDLFVERTLAFARGFNFTYMRAGNSVCFSKREAAIAMAGSWFLLINWKKNV